MKMKRKLALVAAVLGASPAFAARIWDANLGAWVTTIDAANDVGSSGTITLNDWGFKGPTVAGYTVDANDFKVGSGFDSSSVGQIQHVATKSSDYLASDLARNMAGDFGDPSTFAQHSRTISPSSARVC